MTLKNSKIWSNATSHTDYLFNWNWSNPTWDSIVVDSCAYPWWNPKLILEWTNTIKTVSTDNKNIGFYEYNTEKPNYKPWAVMSNDSSLSLPEWYAWINDGNSFKVAKAYTVTFAVNWGSTVVSQIIEINAKATKPADPTRSNYNFAWWYSDSALTKTYDFNTAVTSNITLYAKWNAKSTWATWGGGGGSSYSAPKKEESKVTTWTTNTWFNNEEINLGWEVKDDANSNVTSSNSAEPTITDADIKKFWDEQIEAYKWAFKQWITTMDTVEKARLDQRLTRAELAKMMIVYIQKIKKITPLKTDEPKYDDVDASLWDLADYIKLAYQYQIMGIDGSGNALNEFNPNGLVTRAEYATVFSRVLFWSKYNQSEWPYYEKHIAALKAAGILTKDDPTAEEYRGWVMLMMYRSANTPLKATNETAKEEAKAEEATWAVAKIANPASTYCVEQGWEIEIKEDSTWAQYGVCKLKDGTEVEEWEYFRANHKGEASTWTVASTWATAVEAATGATASTWATATAVTTWATASTWERID